MFKGDTQNLPLRRVGRGEISPPSNSQRLTCMIFPLKFTLDNIYQLNQILDKHTILDMFRLKWTFHCISHLRLHLGCEIALRNPFSQNKSRIVYMYEENMICPNILSILRIPHESYTRNVSCTLNLISKFLLLSLGQYLCWFCWWTISPRGYYPPSSQCSGSDMVY